MKTNAQIKLSPLWHFAVTNPFYSFGSSARRLVGSSAI
jgi:hypothetical protein